MRSKPVKPGKAPFEPFDISLSLYEVEARKRSENAINQASLRGALGRRLSRDICSGLDPVGSIRDQACPSPSGVVVQKCPSIGYSQNFNAMGRPGQSITRENISGAKLFSADID
jgi:hypothetical protein